MKKDYENFDDLMLEEDITLASGSSADSISTNTTDDFVDLEKIAVEDISKRKENKSTYILGTGKHRDVFYADNIRFRDSKTGELTEVSEICEDEDGIHLIADRGSFRSRFNKEANNNELFCVEKNNHKISFFAKKDAKTRGRTHEAKVSGHHKKVVFKNIQNNSDLEYSVSGSRVKEDIVISSPATEYRYSFIVKSENLIPQFIETEKVINFFSCENNEEVFTIPAPFMIDAEGNVSSDVSYEVKEGHNGDMLLSVIADSEWINEEGRAFPVTIDPQVIVSGSSQINTYSWFNGTVSTGASHVVGTLGKGDGECNNKRMYIKVKSLNIPGNPNIEKAELVIYQKSVAINSEKAPKFGIYRVTSGIVTGACTPTSEELLMDYAVMQKEVDGETSEPVKYTFDVTELLDRETSGERIFAVKMLDEKSEDLNTMTLYGNGSAYAPKIEITYSSAYTNDTVSPMSHNIGHFGTGTVDLKRGNLKFNCPIFNWKGNRMPVSINFGYNNAMRHYIYSSNESIGLNVADFSKMIMGTGWMMNYMQSVVYATFVVEGETKQGYIYVDDRATEHFLTESAEEEHIRTDECGNEYHIYSDAYGGSITYDPLKRELYKYGRVYSFDSIGRLTKISEEETETLKRPASIIITYTLDRITSITDGVGREFSFGYNTSGQLTSITAPDGTAVGFEYDSANRLERIIRPGGEYAVITYNMNGPKQIVLNDGNSNNYQVDYTFNGDQCTSITDFNLNKTVFNYHYACRKTVVTSIEAADEDEEEKTVVTTYNMDADGHVISQYAYFEEIGNAEVSGDSSEINPYANSQLGAAVSSMNILREHNFVSSGYWADRNSNELEYWIDEAANGVNTSVKPKFYQSLSLYGNWYLDMQTEDVAAVSNGTYQTTTTLPAGDYTFSAYVRPITKPEGTMSNPGIYLRVTDTDGNILGESNKFAKTGQGFERLEAHFHIDTDKAVKVHILMDGKLEAYVNATQLENNTSANNYNMLVNGGFEYGKNGWLGSGSVLMEDVFNMRRSAVLYGNIENTVNLYQHVNVKTYAGTRETFTLSGWAKGYGIPDHERAGAEAATFRLKARIVYTDGTKEDYTADFSPRTTDWQFASVSFAKNEFKEIQDFDISCEYDYNVGTAYFDDIQLIRTNLETGLSFSDFNDEYDAYSDFDDGSEEIDKYIEDASEVYDDFGNAITSTSFVNGETGAVYRSYGYNEDDPDTDINDAGNNLVKETDARGNTTYHTVDPFTSRDIAIQDRCGSVTEYDYDLSGNITAMRKKDSDGTVRSNVSYAYSDRKKLTAITRGDGVQYDFAYSPFQKLETITVNGLESPLINYTYKNGNGRLKKMTYANGNEVRVTYNSRGQIVAEKWYDAEGTLAAHYKYVRNNAGTIVKTLDILEKIEYTYTYSDNKITRITEYGVNFDENEVVTSRELVCEQFCKYDKEGKLVAKVYTFADGSEFVTKYEENDKTGKVTSFSAAGKTVRSHSKTDSFGRKEFDELRLSCGYINRHFTYHEGKITEEHKASGNIASNPITSLVKDMILSDGRTISYEYDPEERITKVTDSFDGVTAYTYDALGQLTSETVNGIKTVFVYDSYGNILESGLCDDNGNVLEETKSEFTYGNAIWKDLLTSFNGESITYDAGGNPVTYLGHTLTWEKGRQLKSFDSNTYTYNANGIRTSKTVDGVTHRYILNGTKILKETWGENYIIPLYDNANQVCGIIYNDSAYYFLKNLQGDVIAITDNTGKTVATYKYDAWGECTIISDTTEEKIASINPYRYRTYYYDTDTGFYYLNSRYYDPKICRFINADDAKFVLSNRSILENNINAYCCNDPINYVDCYGTMPMAVFYDARTSGYLWGLIGGKGFEKQANIWIDYIEDHYKYEVYSYPFTNIEGFVSSWNTASGIEFDTVFIFAHGEIGSLDCNQQRLLVPCKTSGNPDHRCFGFKDLNKLTTKFLYLFSCHGGSSASGHNSVAYEFANLTNSRVYAVKDGKVNIDYSTGKVSKVDPGSWTLFQKYYRPYTYTFENLSPSTFM